MNEQEEYLQEPQFLSFILYLIWQGTRMPKILQSH